MELKILQPKLLKCWKPPSRGYCFSLWCILFLSVGKQCVCKHRCRSNSCECCEIGKGKMNVKDYSFSTKFFIPNHSNRAQLSSCPHSFSLTVVDAKHYIQRTELHQFVSTLEEAGSLYI